MPSKDPTPDIEIFVLNASAIAWSPKLADAAEAVLGIDGGEFPIVLGGD
ncbi:hypothetical protein P3T31_004675 [Rhizobium sp. AN70]|nr:hypothetical protein [Rhizobium sp. AN70]MDH7804607.1 hypothetical protein [Rhizobium sp. AN70]